MIRNKAPRTFGRNVAGDLILLPTPSITLRSGVWEAVPGERTRAHNTAVLLGPDGSLLLSYRKTHMYDAFGFRSPT